MTSQTVSTTWQQLDYCCLATVSTGWLLGVQSLDKIRHKYRAIMKRGWYRVLLFGVFLTVCLQPVGIVDTPVIITSALWRYFRYLIDVIYRLIFTENEKSKSSLMVNMCLPTQYPSSRPGDVLFLRKLYLKSDRTQLPWDDVIRLLWWSLLTMLPECLLVTMVIMCAAYHLYPKRPRYD